MDCVVFTLHYVSISTASIKNEGGAADKFTFHYVSISTYCPCKRRTPILIYIPLCIYFNVQADYDIRQEGFIYIPLCIYFNIRVSIAFVIWLFIYIPLCIYFNKYIRFVDGKILLFTFHYVSISTNLIIRKDTNQISIYIPLCIYFNWNPVPQQMILMLIYIPLCIYFNNDTSNDKTSVNSFTFHYVSISTSSITILTVLITYLHSTMYLFQQVLIMDFAEADQYLHSTMYLFQPITFVKP